VSTSTWALEKSGCSVSVWAPEDRFANSNYWRRTGATRAWPSGWRGFPFLIRVDGHPAGFALVKRLSEAPATFDMGEFFVARQHRRQGIGRWVATELFDAFGGSWEVREMPENASARHFWRRIIADYTNGAFTEAREVFAACDGKEFTVRRFQSRRCDRRDAMTVWAP
jgi:predicted acetyltransferase